MWRFWVVVCWCVCAFGGVGCSDDASPSGGGGSTSQTGSSQTGSTATSSGTTSETSSGDDVGVSDGGTTSGEDVGEGDVALDVAEDTGEPDAVDEDTGGGGKCAFENAVAADAPRLVAVGHGFSEDPEVDGTRVRLMELSVERGLVDLGQSIDATVRPARLAFTPDGSVLLVLGEGGALVAFRNDGGGGWVETGRVELPAALYGDLRVVDNGRRIHVVGSNVDESSGISTLELSCEGQLTLLPAAFFNLRLSASLALDSTETHGVLLGGQTLFEPIDDRDVRLVSWTGDGWTETAALDIFGDYIDASRIALSPDGSTALIPNGSPFSEEGNQLAVVAVDGAQTQEIARIADLVDAREAIFAPDGRTALVTLLEPGRVVVLSDVGGAWAEVDRVAGVGLPTQIAMVRRGPLSGTALVPATDGSEGPNIAQLQVVGVGEVEDRGQVNFGEGFENIPTSIGVVP